MSSTLTDVLPHLHHLDGLLVPDVPGILVALQTTFFVPALSTCQQCNLWKAAK